MSPVEILRSLLLRGRSFALKGALVLVVACSADVGAESAAPSNAGTVSSANTGDTRVRVVAANLTSGNAQSYEEPGIRILKALAPDVALLQEFKYGSGEIRQLVDVAFGPEFVFFREPRKGGIPNGVVSRWPIVDAGVWEDSEVVDRDFAYARIDIPGPRDLWAISVHFKTGNGGARARQAKAVTSGIAKTIPAGDYVVFGGDLNTGSASETAITQLGAALVVGGPRPSDPSGNKNTNASRSKPYDHVFANGPFDALAAPVTVAGNSYPNGLVFDSRTFGNLAALAPVQKQDSGASNMQHMAVVRDFVVPAPTP